MDAQTGPSIRCCGNAAQPPAPPAFSPRARFSLAHPLGIHDSSPRLRRSRSSLRCAG